MAGTFRRRDCSSSPTITAPGGETITLDGTANLRVDPGATATIGAALVGAGSLLKNDTGTLVLTGSNTYSGGTSVFGGALELRGAGTPANATPITTAFGAELRFFNATTPRAAAISNSGRLKFFDSATGDTATITNQPTAFEAFGVGYTVFADSSNATMATITNLGATSAVVNGGATAFQDSASAGFAMIVNGASSVGNAPSQRRQHLVRRAIDRGECADFQQRRDDHEQWRRAHGVLRGIERGQRHDHQSRSECRRCRDERRCGVCRPSRGLRDLLKPRCDGERR